MRENLRWKLLFVLVIVSAFAFILFGPGRKDPIRLGLDLKGGIELLLVPDYRLGGDTLTKLGEDFKGKLSQKGITATTDLLGSPENNRYSGLKFTFANPDDVTRVKNLAVFQENYKSDQFGEEKNLKLSPTYAGNQIRVQIIQDSRDFPSNSVERAKAIIDNRISEASGGVAEADVRVDAQNRINVQIPGLKSLADAQAIITTTGRLTFRINKKVVLDGRELKDDIRVYFQTGKGYAISFGFKGESAKLLAKITAENIGKPMAVYIDETMLMEPVIQSALPDGSGEITLGNGNKEDAERYALLMKSGSLPISLKAIAVSNVEPTLGKEIVNMSVIAAVVGLIAVMIFMLVFYSLPGLLADLSLIFYGVIVLGVMSMFNGVLTLPGIAGFVLGLGMAVDANVIIFERIKDELRNGKRVRSAVEGGFDRALIAIVDSNVTTLIAATVLFLFGTGAVQGFAVTLTIGVLTSMFSAIFITKTFVELVIDRSPDRYAKHFGYKEVEA